ncbi:hypothetical protein MNAN1_001850 [Malassezia nana]|uniref:Uncharacterized protein n=1 Tax=Malassezia nana TaxID=180528 RepID=A0AAF0EL68_9BASI|nr:hypothetical protein MNAN1_001850 [Malassezia nana]
MSDRVVIPPDEIPHAGDTSLALIFEQLLSCGSSTALRLDGECRQAIAELPEDSRPTTYDSLVDVARFCVEEEPGWDHDACESLISQYPRLDSLHPDSTRLQTLCNQYEALYPGLHFITSDEIREPGMASDELESFLSRQEKNVVHEKGSSKWQAELDRLLEVLWDVAVDRAVTLTPGPIHNESLSILSLDTAAHELEMSDAHTAVDALPQAAEPKAGAGPTSTSSPASKGDRSDSNDEPLLTLADFRALALASPVLQKFFERDLVQSIRLEPVKRSATGNAFAWHAAPVLPRGSLPRNVPGARGQENKTSSTASQSSSLTSALLQSGPASLDADTPASYSRDITTGARGKFVGFLGGLLGEEGKTRMDALADQVALRLQTHSVRGPLPSFSRKEPEPSSGSNTSSWRSAFMRGATVAAGAVADGRALGMGGRLAGALGVSSNKKTPDVQPPPAVSVESNDVQRSGLRGSDLATEGPEAAVASLIAANEALVQERSTFVIDEVQPSDKTADDLEEDTGSMDGSLSALDEDAGSAAP